MLRYPLSRSTPALLSAALLFTVLAACSESISPPDSLNALRVYIGASGDTLTVGQQLQLSAEGRDGKGRTRSVTISWSSSNTNVVRVSSSGLVSAIAIGKAIVTATVDPGGSSATREFVVIAPPPPAVSVASVRITPKNASVVVGATATLSAAAYDASGNVLSGRQIAWANLDPSLADVSSTGVVTGKATGNARIIATSETKADTATVSVQPVTAAVASVDLTPSTATVQVNATTQLTATLRDASSNVLTGRTITWSTSNSGVATVAAGLVTGRAAGSAQIVATSEGKADTSLITVTSPPPAPVASVVVNPATATIQVGATTQLTVTLRDASNTVLIGRTVTWNSLDTRFATVNGSGLVSGVSAGNARIVATSEGKADTSLITVTAPPTGAKIDTIFYEGFESGNLSLWQDGVNATQQAVRTSSTFAKTGSRYLEMMLTGGATDTWLTRFFMPGYDSLYVRMYVRYPAAWSGGSKVFALRGSPINNQWGGLGNAGRCPNGTDFFSSVLTTEAALNPGPVLFYAYYPGMPSSGGSCWGSSGTNAGASYTHASTGLTRDVWHKVEYWVKLNTPGSSNAEQSFWIDGQLWGQWNGISFRSTTDLRLNSLQLSFQNPGNSVYYDDILVTTGKPAP